MHKIGRYDLLIVCSIREWQVNADIGERSPDNVVREDGRWGRIANNIRDLLVVKKIELDQWKELIARDSLN